MTPRLRWAAALLILFGSTTFSLAGEKSEVTRFARFQVKNEIVYGVVEGRHLRIISGDLFGSWERTARLIHLEDVKLLPPTEPKHVFAMAGNYKSHIEGAEIPEKFQIPQPFLKTPSCLLEQNGTIVIPKNSTGPVHYEAEMVIVIGKTARDIPEDKVADYVFGVTCGNDVSERIWQNDEEQKDIQWWRAKGSDTFGPCGPFIARGLDYDNLELTLRLNGEVKQKERTDRMIHGVAATVSFISRHVTLEPGDLIFTGTPGKTDALSPGDVVEVELEGVGVLRNRVIREE